MKVKRLTRIFETMGNVGGKFTRPAKKILSGALVSLLLAAPCLADKVIYKISVSSEDGTSNTCRINMLGEKGSATGWINLQKTSGHDGGPHTYEYVIEDIGAVKAIYLQNYNNVWPDPWKPTKVTVSYPWESGNDYTKSDFVCGETLWGSGSDTSISDGYKAQISNRPPITITAKGTPQRNDTTVSVTNFFNNPTSDSITVMKTVESWEKGSSVALSEEVSNESSTAIGISYESPETVAGTFGASVEQAWSNALSRTNETVTEAGYGREQDFSYDVPAHSAVFRKLVLRVPTKYTLYESSQGKKRFIREPEGPATDTGTGQILQIPQTDRDGNIVPVSWQMIERDFLASMDEVNRQSVDQVKSHWFQNGWVYAGSQPPVAHNNQPQPERQERLPVPPKVAGHLVFGSYQRGPVENAWHKGSITKAPGGGSMMRWTNDAGVSWDLKPDLPNGRLVLQGNHPYVGQPGGDTFDLVIENEKVTGFRFQGELYSYSSKPQLSAAQQLSGLYERTPYNNQWHRGYISQGANGELQWENEAGVAWTLTPDLANKRMDTGSRNPYRNNPNGRFMNLLYNSNGEVTGFEFNGDTFQVVNTY